MTKAVEYKILWDERSQLESELELARNNMKTAATDHVYYHNLNLLAALKERLQGNWNEIMYLENPGGPC